jgi:sphingosine kinase
MSIKHNKNNINSTNWRPSNLEFDYLPKLNEPVPDDWSIIEDEFILFLISNLPMIGPDFLSAPEATFNDGYMHVLYVRKGTNRMDIVKFLLDTSTDEYYKLPFIEHVKIKAFRLEPLDSLEMATTTTRTIQNEDAGVMMVDGERVKFGPIQGEIRPGMANALA